MPYSDLVLRSILPVSWLCVQSLLEVKQLIIKHTLQLYVSFISFIYYISTYDYNIIDLFLGKVDNLPMNTSFLKFFHTEYIQSTST